MRMIEAVRAAITEEMERDERVLVMGEDVGRKGGVFGATEGLYAKFGEARVLDMPLAESGIVGIAIGAALNGLIPIAEIQFADFIHPAFDQIVSASIRSSARPRARGIAPTETGPCPSSSARRSVAECTEACITRNRSRRSTRTCPA